jgi:hypothetical protein
MFKSNIMKPITNVVVVSSFTALLLCGLAAQTAVAANAVDPDFKKLDVDADHKISLQEAMPDKVLSVNFDVVDANNDSFVSVEEFASYKASLAAATSGAAGPAGSPAPSEGKPPMPAPVN